MTKEQVMQMLSNGLDQIQCLQIQATGPNVEIIQLCINTFLETYKWIGALELINADPAKQQEQPAQEQQQPEQPEQPEQEEPNEDGREI